MIYGCFNGSKSYREAYLNVCGGVMQEIECLVGINTETDIGSWSNTYKGVKEGTYALLRLFQENT